MTDHPTDAERFFFDNNGYLVLEDFLVPNRVAALYAALERTIERRRDPQFKREHDPAFADRSTRPTCGSCTFWPRTRSFWRCSTTSR